MRQQVSWFKRLFLGGAARIEIYELLALLLDNRVLLIDALREIRNVLNGPTRGVDAPTGAHADDVKIRNVRAEAVHHWVLRLKGGDKDGFPLSRAMSEWVPPDEAALIRAGETTGNLSRALKDAVEGIMGKGEMIKAAAGGVTYPLVLFAGAYFVMRIFANQVIPKFTSQFDPSTWEGPARLLYLECHAFTNYGLPAIIGVTLLVVLVFTTMPYYNGPGRVALDRLLPPWNIYKAIQGATFLKNVAVQTRAGIRLYDSVSGMIELSTPWLHKRLAAAMYGIEQGQNLGEALHNADYEFPDKRSVQILRVLASRDGFDETLYSFAGRWQEQTIRKVKAASNVFFAVGLLTIGGVAGSAFAGMQGISAMIADHADNVSNSAGR